MDQQTHHVPQYQPWQCLPVLPTITCHKELACIIVDSPQKMEDEQGGKMGFEICLMVLQPPSDCQDLDKVVTFLPKQHFQ